MAADLDSAEWILQQSHNYPLLTAEQEIILNRHVQAWLPLRDKAEPTKREKAIIRRGKRAYDTFYLSNIRLVVTCAGRYTRVSGTLGLDDLIQEGLVGLERAIVKFDATRGYKFSTYAFNWIRQSINRGISNHSRTIRVPIHGIEVLKKATNYMRERQRITGKVPSLEDTAEHCGCQVPTLKMYLFHNATCMSLDDQVKGVGGTPEGSTWFDLIAAEQEEPNYLNEREDLVCKLEQAMDHLSDKQRKVIEMRHFDKSPRTFQEIADTIGISRQAASTHHRDGLRRLRLRLTRPNHEVLTRAA